MHRPRILYSEDNPEYHAVVRRALEAAGCHVVTAPNGAEAVNTFRSAPFDLVLMDIQMPVMDGFEATRQIRLLDQGRQIPVIAFTALSGEDIVRQCLAAGMNTVLQKPAPHSALLAMVDQWLSERPSVLVVDDMDDSRRLLQRFLKDLPVPVRFARNGIEAIAACRDDRHIALILMDMEMPVMDGYSAARAIRPLLGDRIPIIAMTAHEGQAEVRKCLAAGCSGYLKKPVSREQLTELVARHVPSSNTGGLQPAPEETSAQPVVCIDPDIAELVPRFLANRNRDVAELGRRLQEGDLGAVRIIGHSMAGSAGGYGFPEIGRIGKEIEQAALNREPETIRHLVEELASYLAAVRVTTRTP